MSMKLARVYKNFLNLRKRCMYALKRKEKRKNAQYRYSELQITGV